MMVIMLAMMALMVIMLAMFLCLGSQWCSGAGLVMMVIMLVMSVRRRMCSSRGDGDNVGDDADDGDNSGDDADRETICVIHLCSPKISQELLSLPSARV